MTAPQAATPVIECAGVPITASTRAEGARLVLHLASTPMSGVDVHLCNAYTLSLADRDHDYRDMLCRATVNFPDGKSVVWANWLRHRELDLPLERVYGPDLFRDVLSLGQEGGLRHFLLGSTPPVLAALRARIGTLYPDATIVGIESPPFRELTGSERRDQADRIRASGAQVVWVGLGTPKQDWEATRLAAELPVVAVAVGAAFDFLAGSKPQAPVWMQRNGLEWVFRLSTEPRRLWRRYLFGNARFLYAASRRR